MFWNDSNKCPVEKPEKEWIEESLLWFEEKLGRDFFLSKLMVVPTMNYFGRKLTASEDSARFCLEKVVGWMDADIKNIRLTFYSEETIEFSEGLSTHIDSVSKTSAGKYRENESGEYEIMIEVQQLKDPVSLIGTFAHEVAHVKLLGEWKLVKNDEHLTDLATVVWGMGVFTANSVIKSNAWQGSSHYGWSLGNQGYMTQQMYGYALALLANYRNEKAPKWADYLCRDVSAYFKRALRFIENNSKEIKFKN